MDKFFYYLFTFLESALSVVGIRTTYEEPRYAVIERLDRGVEVRAYEPRVAVETDARGQQDGEAFGRLFRYITGANKGGARIAMTTPVETGGKMIAMTVPVEQARAGRCGSICRRMWWRPARPSRPNPACGSSASRRSGWRCCASPAAHRRRHGGNSPRS